MKVFSFVSQIMSTRMGSGNTYDLNTHQIQSKFARKQNQSKIWNETDRHTAGWIFDDDRLNRRYLSCWGLKRFNLFLLHVFSLLLLLFCCCFFSPPYILLTVILCINRNNHGFSPSKSLSTTVGECVYECACRWGQTDHNNTHKLAAHKITWHCYFCS